MRTFSVFLFLAICATVRIVNCQAVFYWLTPNRYNVPVNYDSAPEISAESDESADTQLPFYISSLFSSSSSDSSSDESEFFFSSLFDGEEDQSQDSIRDLFSDELPSDALFQIESERSPFESADDFYYYDTEDDVMVDEADSESAGSSNSESDESSEPIYSSSSSQSSTSIFHVSSESSSSDASFETYWALRFMHILTQLSDDSSSEEDDIERPEDKESEEPKESVDNLEKSKPDELAPEDHISSDQTIKTSISQIDDELDPEDHISSGQTSISQIDEAQENTSVAVDSVKTESHSISSDDYIYPIEVPLAPFVPLGSENEDDEISAPSSKPDMPISAVYTDADTDGIIDPLESESDDNEDDEISAPTKPDMPTTSTVDTDAETGGNNDQDEIEMEWWHTLATTISMDSASHSDTSEKSKTISRQERITESSNTDEIDEFKPPSGIDSISDLDMVQPKVELVPVVSSVEPELELKVEPNSLGDDQIKVIDEDIKNNEITKDESPQKTSEKKTLEKPMMSIGKFLRALIDWVPF